MRVLTLIAVFCALAATAFAAETENSNPPWFPSLQAFEHYDSGRSHVFSQAEFLGSFHQPNRVEEVRSPDGVYPSGYNMSYLNEHAAFIQGGSYGGIPPSIGPFVARINPRTLETVWKNQLTINDTAAGGNGDWNYPGGMAIMNDGFIYVVSGYFIYKVNPVTGATVDQLQLPTMVKMQTNWPCNDPVIYSETAVENKQNTAYNGINAMLDGTIILKSLYRVAGCTIDGPDAFQCDPNNNLPQSFLVSVDPGRNGKPMKKIDQVTLPHFVGAPPTITRYNGVDYVYLLSQIATPIRYSVKHGVFTFDTNWQAQAFNVDGKQQAGSSLIVMNEWIVGATNSVPATGPITIFAIHQGDPTNVHWVQPFKEDPVPPLLAFAYQGKAPNPPFQCEDNNNPPPPD